MECHSATNLCFVFFICLNRKPSPFACFDFSLSLTCSLTQSLTHSLPPPPPPHSLSLSLFGKGWHFSDFLVIQDKSQNNPYLQNREKKKKEENKGATNPGINHSKHPSVAFAFTFSPQFAGISGKRTQETEMVLLIPLPLPPTPYLSPPPPKKKKKIIIIISIYFFF